MSRTFQQQLVVNSFEAMMVNISQLTPHFDWREPIRAARAALDELEQACKALDQTFSPMPVIQPSVCPVIQQTHPPLAAAVEPKRVRRRSTPAIAGDST